MDLRFEEFLEIEVVFLSFRVLSLGKKRHLLRAGSRFDSRVVLTVAFSRMPRTMLVTHVGTNFDHAPLAFRGRFSVIDFV